MMKNTLILLNILILLGITPLNIPVSRAQEPKRVAILPFTVHADRDLTFLEEGVVDMLTTRLAWKGEVEVLEKGRVKKKVEELGGPLDQAKALEVGKALQVDYVILGSLTVFGDSVSMDARILDVAKSEELMTAFTQSKGMDEVIPTVNRFAQDINEKVMGRPVVRTPVQAAVPEAEPGPKGLIDVREGFGGGRLGHTQRMGVEIVGMDVGDVDGDGLNDVVFVSTDTVYVYTWKGKGFSRIGAIEGGSSNKYLYVSVGDIDQDGRAEVYVSNILGQGVSSLVLEWDGNGFKKIADREKWFFRVVDMPGQRKTLIGQKRTGGGTYTGHVQFLKMDGTRLMPTGPLSLPRDGNVFNFAQGDLAGNGTIHTVLLDSYERLALYDHGGQRIWRSEDFFGGTNTYMEDKTAQGYARVGDVGEYVFIPSPIFLTDIDGDGRQEVAVCSNHSRSGRMFDVMRNFSSGKVHFMTWDKVGGLSKKYDSQKLSGAVVGYNVADVDHDGSEELVVAFVSKGARVMSKGRSQLAVYDLE